MSVETSKSGAVTIAVHPSADVAYGAVIGTGTRIWHNAQVREDARIGAHCIIGKGAYIDAGVTIGNNVKIQNRASIYYGTTIEDGVFVGPHVVFANDRLPRAINPDGTLKTSADWEVGTIHVAYGASIGAGSIILPGVTIGRFALVGAGSVVTRSVPDYALVVGNPARVVGYVCACGHRLAMDEHGGRCPECGRRYGFRDAGLPGMGACLVLLEGEEVSR